MAETTEGVVIQNEIDVKTDKAVKSVDTLHKKLMKVEKTLNGVETNGHKVSEVFKALQKVKFKTLGEKNIKDLQAGFEGVSTSLGEINRYFKALELSLTKQVSLLNRVAVAAQKANIQYGNYASANANINKAKYNQAKTDFLYGTATGQKYLDKEQKKFERDIRRSVIEEKHPEFGRKRRIQEGVEKWNEKQEVLNQTLGVTQLRLMANYAAIGAVTSGLKYVLNYTVQYDKELKQLQAISAISDTGLQNLKTTIEEVANSTKFSSLEIAQASTVLAQAGLSVSQIKDTLPSIANLATGTGTDLATATDVITSTLNIYELQVTEATRVTNSLTTAMNESKADISGFQTAIQYAGNFAAQLGMTYEETAAAIAAATQAGIRSKSMLGTGLRAVLTEFLKPTDKLIAQLESVGLTVDDINVKTKGFNNVLKTLKEAGFGAEEAFRGMERRGAAFLAALINQTDYMDQLRMSMAGSTAAVEANAIQMESLSAQWDNFKNILASTASNGLEPVTKVLSKMLSLVNKFLQLKGVKIGGGILFGGLAGTAGFATLKTLGGSLKNIYVSLLQIGEARKVFTNLNKEFETLKALKLTEVVANFKSLANVLKLLISLPFVKSFFIFTAIAGLYKGAKALGLLTSEVDKLKASLEEASGNMDKTASELNTIAGYTNRLYVEQEKLNNEAERNIFAREMITRLPEARKYIDLTNVSMEDLHQAMSALNDISLKKYVREVAEAARVTKKLAEAAKPEAVRKSMGKGGWKWNDFENMSPEEINKHLKNLTALAGSTGILDLYSKLPKLNSVYGYSTPSGNFQFRDSHSYSKYQKDTASALEKTLNADLESKGISRELRAGIFRSWATELGVVDKDNPFIDMLNKMADELEAEVKLVNARLDQTMNTWFKGDNEKIVKEYSEAVNKAEEALTVYKDRMNEVNHNTLLNAQESLNNFKEHIDQLEKTKTFEDFVKLIGDKGEAENIFKKIRSQKGMENATDEQIIKAFIKDRKEDLKGIEEVIYRVRAEIVTALNEGNSLGLGPKDLKGQAYTYQKSMTRAANRGDVTKFNEMLKNYFVARLGGENLGMFTGNSVDWSSYGSLSEEGRKNIVNQLIAKGNLNTEQALRLKDIFTTINDNFDTLNEKLGSNAVTISKFEQNTREFFRVLSAGIENVEKEYNTFISRLEKPLAAQRGRATAASDYYGSSSGMVTYESNRLEDMEKAQRGVRLVALRRYRAGLVEQLKKLRSNELYGTAQSNYDTALANYNAAFKSGDVRKIEDTNKILDIASKNLKDFTKQEADLTKKIGDLDVNIEELDYSINGLINESKKTSWGKFSTGADAALSNWRKDRQETIGQGWMTNFGLDLTKTGIEELETGFANLFTTVVDGSKEAGDAFKDMARSVLTAMRDIAIQKMATAAVNTLFSFGGMASGGLVLGPEKNRDSVPTMLMPGEFVMKKSAVDALGADYLNRLNNSNGSVISTSSAFVESAKGSTTSGGSTGAGGVVNVYVVGQQQQQQMTPNDVVVTITNDMLKGGQTKKLVKQIAMGGI